LPDILTEEIPDPLPFSAYSDNALSGPILPDLPDEEPPPADRPLSTGPAIVFEGEGSAALEGDQVKDSDRKYLTGPELTYVGGGSENLGMFSLIFSKLEEPGEASAYLLGRPGWGITWLSGPETPEVPPRLYQFSIPLGTGVEGDEWKVSASLTPAWMTDGVNRRPEMFRLMGHAALTRKLSDNNSLTAGFVYLNRDDIAALPVAGIVIDQPDRGRRLELVFPRPHLAWRLHEFSQSSYWLTMTGELGGGSYAIKHQDRTPDVMTYHDLRMITGVEFHDRGELAGRLEAGWVFDRSLEFRTNRGNQDLKDTFLVRMTLAY